MLDVDDLSNATFWLSADGGFFVYARGGADLLFQAVNTGGGELGFYGAPAVARPVVPLTLPSVQNVITALVALGLVAQHD